MEDEGQHDFNLKPLHNNHPVDVCAKLEEFP